MSPDNNQKLAMMLRGGQEPQQAPQPQAMPQQNPQQGMPNQGGDIQQIIPIYQKYAQQAQAQGEQVMPFQQFAAEVQKQAQQNQSLLQQQPGINQQMNRPQPQQPMPPQALPAQ